MSKELNGLKKWLVGTITTVALALGAWVGSSIVSHGNSIAGQQQRQESFEAWLERLDHKLDRVLERVERHR